jgi:hypothetical protein
MNKQELKDPADVRLSNIVGVGLTFSAMVSLYIERIRNRVVNIRINIESDSIKTSIGQGT